MNPANRHVAALREDTSLRPGRLVSLALVTACLYACAPLTPIDSKRQAEPEAPARAEPPAAEVPEEITSPPIDPMRAVVGDKPLPVAKGRLERIDCLNGREELHARMALEARGGQITSFAYYSRWQFRTCSIHLDQRDARIRWQRTVDGATRVQTPQGSFVIRADPKFYVFEFQDVQRMKFCGMFGSINGTMTVSRTVKPPRCSLAGILDR